MGWTGPYSGKDTEKENMASLIVRKCDWSLGHMLKQVQQSYVVT